MAERKYLMLLRPPQQPCLVARQITFLLISPGIRRVPLGECAYIRSRCTTRMPHLWGCSAHDNALGGTAFFGFYGLWLFCCDSTIALPQERPSFGQPFITIAHTIFLEQFMSGFPNSLKYTTFKKHSLSNSLIFIKSHAVLSRDMFWTSFKATFILKEML